MKKKTLTLRMAVVGFMLSGCGHEGSSPLTTINPAPTNVPKQTVPAVSSHSSTTKTRALVYSGPGACAEECASSAYNMAIRSGLAPTYVGPTDLNAQSTDADRVAFFKDVAVWIQPGGKSSTVLQSMSPEMIAAIQAFVNDGGGYVGFCAGAFSSTKVVGTTNINGYGIFPGKTALYKDPNDAEIFEVQWEGKTRQVYWEGGPYISEVPMGMAEEVAYYPNGQIAAAKSYYGQGKIFIAGFHPEAPQSWRDYYHMSDADGLDYDLVDEMISWVTH